MVLFAESIDDDCTTRALEENGNVHAESIDVDCKARALDENENIYMYEESIKVDNEVEDEDGKTVIDKQTCSVDPKRALIVLFVPIYVCFMIELLNNVICLVDWLTNGSE